MLKKLNELPMKKKILLSNTIMVLFSMLILLIVSIIMIEIFEHQFLNLIVSELEVSGESNTAKTLLELPNLKVVQHIYLGFKISFAIVSIFFIIGNVLLNNFITKKLIKSLSKPLDLLNVATDRVSNGDYEEPINYPLNDEFTYVCNNFDKMQATLKEQKEKNEAYERARIDMISGISHDLRTPLTSIKGFIKGIIDGVADTTDKQTRYLQIAYDKSCDMDVLISKMFEFSKIETGNMPIFLQKTNLDMFVYDYIERKKLELDEKNILIEYSNNINEGEELICVIDRERIDRVIDNIIENSIKYSDSDTLKIKFYIEKIKNNDGLYAKLTISDNGVGVLEEKIRYIFDQFYRADEARGSEKDGSGLGLYICKYLVESCGGKIDAFNNLGLNITIMLPLNKNEGDTYV